KGGVTDLAFVTLPGDAAELERLAAITHQLRSGLPIQVGLAHALVPYQLGPECFAAICARAGAGYVAESIVLGVENLSALGRYVGIGVIQPQAERLRTVDAEALEDVEEARAICIHNLALDGADALELM